MQWHLPRVLLPSLTGKSWRQAGFRWSLQEISADRFQAIWLSFAFVSPHNEAKLPPTIRRHYTTLFSAERYDVGCGLSAVSAGIEVGTVRTRSGGRFFC